MRAGRLAAGAPPTDPGAPAWQRASTETVALEPVPLDQQPTGYIRAAWAGRSYGRTAGARLAALHDGERLHVRVEWDDDAEPNGEFLDAAGVLFPLEGGGSLGTLGSAEAPVALWYWEDGRPAPLGYTARGPGVFYLDGEDGLGASARLEAGRWSLVLSGPAAPAAREGRLGLVVWNGSNEERAGLAAVSQAWVPLELE
jgi:DMSO reductase family type II enzyme heme b subunit